MCQEQTCSTTFTEPIELGLQPLASSSRDAGGLQVVAVAGATGAIGSCAVLLALAAGTSKVSLLRHPSNGCFTVI